MPNTETTVLFGIGDLSNAERLLFGSGAPALQTTASLPPMRAVLPDFANGSLSDIPYRRHSIARQNVAIRHDLQVDQCGAGDAPLMRGMGLDQDPGRIRVAEV